MERVSIFFVAAFLSLASGTALAEEEHPLNSAELEKGFALLFNGRDLRNWRNQGNWTVVDGAITRVGRGGNLVYERAVIHEPFFELRFEWKVVEQGDSVAKEGPVPGPPDGCFFTEFRVTSTESDSRGAIVRQLGQMAHFYAAGGGAVGLFGPEKPLLPDAPIGFSTSSGPTKRTSRTIGQWNSSRIVWTGETICHWLNGEKVVQFDFRPLEGSLSVVDRMIAQLRIASTQALKDGLHVQLEADDIPMMYRGIMFRRMPRK